MSQAMVRRPPWVSTSTGPCSKPSRMPATTAAQAPVPQARVSPAPRSNTRSRMWPGLTTCMKPAFTRLGNAGWRSTSGPSVATGAVSTSGTTHTACGLPMDTAAINTVAACEFSSSGSCHFCQEFSGTATSPAGLNGMRAGSKIGAPMSTVTRPSSFMRSSITPCLTWTRTTDWSVSPCSRTNRTKQRAPLPQCSTSPPSAL